MNLDALKRLATPQNMARAVVVVYIYDVIKFMSGYGVMDRSGINPWTFLFIDLVTVPGYFIGWHKLLKSMGGKEFDFRYLVKWGVITFYCSTGPYLYALWSGRGTASALVWWVLFLIILILTVNMIRKICKNLSHIKA